MAPNVDTNVDADVDSECQSQMPITDVNTNIDS